MLRSGCDKLELSISLGGLVGRFTLEEKFTLS
jgi:hypothetical protein